VYRMIHNVVYIVRKQKEKKLGYFYLKLSGFSAAPCNCRHVFALK
jgi:hypothetical protein